MQIVNNRLIIEETELTMDCKRIESIVRGFMYSKGHADSFVEVEFCQGQYNEETHQIWNDLVIHLIHANGCESFIICTTDSYVPNLVNIDDKFKFYYVFEFGSETITDEYTLLNGSYPGMVSLEQMIWQHLQKTFDTASYNITLNGGN